MDETLRRAELFRISYENRLQYELADAMVDYQDISQRRSIISTYMHLSYDVDLYNNALQKRKCEVSERIAREH
eukprot:10239572-Ditylum_brightwellii.AAC.1